MVPEDWESSMLGQLVRIHAGEAPAKLHEVDVDGVPYVKVEDMNNCTKYQRVSRVSVQRPKKIVPSGAVLFPKRGAAIMNNKVRISETEMVIDTNMMALEPNKDLDTEFLYYSVTYTKLFKIADTSTIPQINNKHINPYRILLPAKSEQSVIAKVISTWDRAIETTEKLIENSQAQKKALMQQLLTGKKRLPGFDGEWRERTLSSFGETYSGLAGKSKQDFGQGKPYLQYKNVFSNPAADFTDLELVTVSPQEKQHSVEHGDILFTTSSEVPKEVGMSSVAINPRAGVYLNSFCFGFRPRAQSTLDPLFAKHYFRSAFARRKISSLAQGSTRYNLSKRELVKILFPFPCLDEQKAIARIVEAASKEEDLLARRLLKLKTEKTALMQQLLTGKRRVKVEEAADA